MRCPPKLLLSSYWQKLLVKIVKNQILLKVKVYSVLPLEFVPFSSGGVSSGGFWPGTRSRRERHQFISLNGVESCTGCGRVSNPSPK